MIAATAYPEVKAPFQKMPPMPVLKKAEKADSKRISWEDFERRYLSREDKFKYEWVDGEVEKTERTMNQYQSHLADNLLDFFNELKNQQKVEGRLREEIDTFFLPKVHRRPDLAWFSEAQRVKMAQGENQVPEFVIEVISNRDSAKQLHKKMKNYENAGVKVVWVIYPETEDVVVFHGNKSVALSGNAICSAAPVLPEFSMKVSDIFKKPA